jgi:hypothetical protein
VSTPDDALKWAQKLTITGPLEPLEFYKRGGGNRLDQYYCSVRKNDLGGYCATYWPYAVVYSHTGTFDECKQWLIAMIASGA